MLPITLYSVWSRYTDLPTVELLVNGVSKGPRSMLNPQLTPTSTAKSWAQWDEVSWEPVRYTKHVLSPPRCFPHTNLASRRRGTSPPSHGTAPVQPSPRTQCSRVVQLQASFSAWMRRPSAPAPAPPSSSMAKMPGWSGPPSYRLRPTLSRAHRAQCSVGILYCCCECCSRRSFAPEQVDKAGNLVADATNNVTFKIVSGPGRIIGAHNGDPQCHEPNQVTWHSAYHGLVRAVIMTTEDKSSAPWHRARLQEIDGDSGSITLITPHSGDSSVDGVATPIVVEASAANLPPVRIAIPTSTDTADGVMEVAAASAGKPVAIV